MTSTSFQINTIKRCSQIFSQAQLIDQSKSCIFNFLLSFEFFKIFKFELFTSKSYIRQNELRFTSRCEISKSLQISTLQKSELFTRNVWFQFKCYDTLLILQAVYNQANECNKFIIFCNQKQWRRVHKSSLLQSLRVQNSSRRMTRQLIKLNESTWFKISLLMTQQRSMHNSSKKRSSLKSWTYNKRTTTNSTDSFNFWTSKSWKRSYSAKKITSRANSSSRRNICMSSLLN